MTNTTQHTPEAIALADNILKAAGSGLKHYSMHSIREAIMNSAQKGIDDARAELLEALKASREMFYTLGDKDTQESKDCFALYEMCDAALAKTEPSSNNSK